MTRLDILIAAPAIPILPLLVTWWPPWERWIPWGKLPKIVIEPYVLYLSFVGWHFHFSPWAVFIAVLAGIGLSVVGAVEAVQKAR